MRLMREHLVDLIIVVACVSMIIGVILLLDWILPGQPFRDLL